MSAAPLITITPHPARVRVTLGGTVLAETDRAMTLREGSYPPVLYLPRDDIRMDLFAKTDRRTHCPHKGDASYYTARAGGEERRDCAWSYEAPLPGAAAIAGHFAFYPDRVDSIAEIG